MAQSRYLLDMPLLTATSNHLKLRRVEIRKSSIRALIFTTLLSGCNTPPPQDPGFGSFDGIQTSTPENTSDITTIQTTSTSGEQDGSTTGEAQTISGTMETSTDQSTTEIDQTTGMDSISSSTGNGLAICGNGIKEGNEVCDDGLNDGSYEGCKNDCSEEGPHCGDGINQEEHGEECDDGNNSNLDSCTNDCKTAFCGDAHLQNGIEECDEGFSNSNVGSCTDNCKNATCGDGHVQYGVEECDDGDQNNNEYGCGTNCQHALEWCGDGKLQEERGEQCDQYAGTVPEIGCKENCKFNLSKVNQLICGGSCSYAGGLGCDEEDADLMCKLITGKENATAQGYSYEGSVSKATDANGFGCSDKNKFFDDGEGKDVRLSLGEMYGTEIFFVPGGLTVTHAGIDSITSVACDEN